MVKRYWLICLGCKRSGTQTKRTLTDGSQITFIIHYGSINLRIIQSLKEYYLCVRPSCQPHPCVIPPFNRLYIHILSYRVKVYVYFSNTVLELKFG